MWHNKNTHSFNKQDNCQSQINRKLEEHVSDKVQGSVKEIFDWMDPFLTAVESEQRKVETIEANVYTWKRDIRRISRMISLVVKHMSQEKSATRNVYNSMLQLEQLSDVASAPLPLAYPLASPITIGTGTGVGPSKPVRAQTAPGECTAKQLPSSPSLKTQSISRPSTATSVRVNADPNGSRTSANVPAAPTPSSSNSTVSAMNGPSLPLSASPAHGVPSHESHTEVLSPLPEPSKSASSSNSSFAEFFDKLPFVGAGADGHLKMVARAVAETVTGNVNSGIRDRLAGLTSAGHSTPSSMVSQPQRCETFCDNTNTIFGGVEEDLLPPSSMPSGRKSIENGNVTDSQMRLTA